MRNYIVGKEFAQEKCLNLEDDEVIYLKLDFKYDIDNQKSDYYIVDKYTNMLQIICKKEKSLLKHKGHFVEDTIINKGKIIIKSNEDNSSSHIQRDMWKGSSIYQMDYLRKDDDIFRLLINLNDVKQGKFMAYFSKKLLNPNCDWSDFVRLSIGDNDENIMFNFRSENSPYYYRFDKFEGETTVEYIFDFKNNNIYRNNSRCYKLNNQRVNFKNLYNITLCWYSYYENKELYVNENDISIGNKEGIIYLKPISLNNKKFLKVKSLYKGNFNMEVYLPNSNKWESIKKFQNIIRETHNKIYLRLCMKDKDLVDSIYLISKNL